MKGLTTYILKCTDNSYYTGVTNNIQRRLEEHNQGRNQGCYTFKRRPVVLVWHNLFQSKLKAISWEKKLKGWTRKKKEALIEGKIQLLNELSECKNESHYKNHASTPLSMTD